MAGLRELKKARTRQIIAETADDLFRRRGFDDVTVDEIAQLAEVSKKTVFNYFPTKEDLVFHRADDREAALMAAVAEGLQEDALLESLRRLCLRQTRLIERLRRNVGDGSGGFFDLVNGHPALQRKLREIDARLVQSLAGAVAEQTGTSPDDPLTVSMAWTFISVQRTLYRSLRERAAGSATDAAIGRAHHRDVNRIFDQLRDGLADYPAKVTPLSVAKKRLA
jgi:AcrR family transcriptional regulator